MHSPCISFSLVILLFFRPIDSTCNIKLTFLMCFGLFGRPFNKDHMQALNLFQDFNLINIIQLQVVETMLDKPTIQRRMADWVFNAHDDAPILLVANLVLNHLEFHITK